MGVSNGTVGGARMIENLRPIIENYGAAMRETVILGPIQNILTTAVNCLSRVDKRIEGLLKSLTWWAEN